MENIINTIKKKKRLHRIFMMFLSLLLNAAVYNIFLLPLNIVSGGTGGVATITNHIYNINPALMIFILSTACIIISFLFLGRERTMGSIAAAFVFPLLVRITSPINQIFQLPKNDIFIIVIFAGLLSGLANGIMYKTGYSNGGFPIISQVLEKYFKISISKSSFIINIIIIIIGAYFFGTTNAMYAIILLYINNIVLDRVLLGLYNNKYFYIITSQEEKIKDYLINTMGHSVTELDIKGGILEKKRQALLAVIPTKEYYRVTEGIKKLDKEAFFVVTDSYQVKGGK